MRRHNKIFKILVYFLFIFLSFEGTSQLGFRMISGRWLWDSETYCYQRLFQKHPWLVVAPKANAKCSNEKKTFTFNSLGFRGADFSLAKLKDKKRIICYGGSSTFCTQVSDNQTWVYFLQEILRDKFQVINAGFPGYSSAEAIIQTALQQFDLYPDICIYYLGWNDLRNTHIKNLKSDYSDFHGSSQLSNLRLEGWLPDSRFAIAQIIRLITARISQEKNKLQGEVSSLLDERALNIYKYNLRTIIAICRSRGTKLIMVPQILNYTKLTKETPYNWAPFIREKDVQLFMQAYNQAMREVCEEEKVIFADNVLAEEWEVDDFVDEGHFSVKGNRKFAMLIAQLVSNSK